MEKRNKFLIAFIGSIILIIIVIATIVKVYTNHIDHLYYVVESKIIESTKKCYLEEVCTGEEVTLKDLIEKDYIDKQIDPKSKEYIDENIKITNDGTTWSVDIRK